MAQFTPNLPPQGNNILPWLDVRIAEKTMNHLWDMINHPITPPTNDPNNIYYQGLFSGGPNNKVYDIEDKNNWFFENVLKECAEMMHYRDWSTYYNVHIAHAAPPTVFALKEMWVNHQKQHEFIPPHNHNGGIGFSFVVFMKIPTHWKDQQELPWLKNVKNSQVSDFQFLLQQLSMEEETISLCPDDAGRMLFFPAWFLHQVFPFYECDEERVTISGNVQ